VHRHGFSCPGHSIRIAMPSFSALCGLLAHLLIQPTAAMNCSACTKPDQCQVNVALPGISFHWSQHQNDKWIKWFGAGTLLLVEDSESDQLGNDTLTTLCNCLWNECHPLCVSPTYYLKKDDFPQNHPKKEFSRPCGHQGWFPQVHGSGVVRVDVPQPVPRHPNLWQSDSAASGHDRAH